jgi:hypothetical protein
MSVMVPNLPLCHGLPRRSCISVFIIQLLSHAGSGIGVTADVLSQADDTAFVISAALTGTIVRFPTYVCTKRVVGRGPGNDSLATISAVRPGCRAQ